MKTWQKVFCGIIYALYLIASVFLIIYGYTNAVNGDPMGGTEMGIGAVMLMIGLVGVLFIMFAWVSAIELFKSPQA